MIGIKLCYKKIILEVYFMSNIKRRTMSALLVLSLVFTMFAVNTVPTHAATKTLKLKASASGQTQAVLTWNKISKPYSGYAVFRDGRIVKYFGKGTTKFTDSGLASGSAYSYQIKSYKKTKQYYNSKKKKWVLFSHRIWMFNTQLNKQPLILLNLSALT